MKNRQYQYQGFLLQCPYQNIDLEKHQKQTPKNTQSFIYERNLFDFLDYKRQIPLSFLDSNVDTEGDLDKIIHSLKDVQALYIVDDRVECENDFVKNHSKATKQAFVWHFENKGIPCFITDKKKTREYK
ncbi:hypothetical protein [Fibrobacter intestinalis]|uniref:Rhodanese domain-containing protein n=1 Tax=Fibrobacter intestinalis TaxID=28122 RepID=A0A1T4PZ45_9BACT|nr:MULTISPECIES: hypothetical protein [Fibrobacter]PBC72768.1 hypothetical protein BGW94_0346 [Fibrobacter sp. NR9]SJZ96802.1 hypothetical protein SAMN02745108_02107 [Fibrobacter intestinalis]